MPDRRPAPIDAATQPQLAPDDAALRARLRDISTKKKRWGYRRAHARLIEEGWDVNRKRVQRLWRSEGLRVPRRKRKRARLGDNADGRELRAERPDHVWALDFQGDETADGRALRVLNVIDEFTREALASEVARSITAEDTVRCSKVSSPPARPSPSTSAATTVPS